MIVAINSNESWGRICKRAYANKVSSQRLLLSTLKISRHFSSVHFETGIFGNRVDVRVESLCNLEKVFDPSTFPVSFYCNDAEDFVAPHRASRHATLRKRKQRIGRETRLGRRRKIDKKCDIVNGSVLLTVFQTYRKTNWSRRVVWGSNVKFLTTSKSYLWKCFERNHSFRERSNSQSFENTLEQIDRLVEAFPLCEIPY